MPEELKPCPFCGVDDIVLGHKVTDDLYMVPHSWYIKCRQCGCTLFDFDSDEEAIKAWNHRATDGQACSGCTWYRISEAFNWCELVHQKRDATDYCSKWRRA